MLMLETGNSIAELGMPARRRSGACGFTLLELLVVMALIGILGGVAMLSIRLLDGKALQAEAERLSEVLQLASQDAVLGGRVLGLFVSPTEYRVARYGRDGWSPLEAEPLFKHWVLADDLEFVLAPSSRAQTGDRDPFIVFLPNEIAEVPALVVSDRQSGDRIRIAQSIDGSFSLQRITAP